MTDDRLDRLAVLARRAGHADLADLVEQSAVPEPEEHWSDWFKCSGTKPPVPPATVVMVETGLGCATAPASVVPWQDGMGFRYRADNAEGWLPRPAGWVPLGAKCRFEVRAKGSVETKFFDGEMPEWSWAQVTHIRLLPRQAEAPKLPDGFRVTPGGSFERMSRGGYWEPFLDSGTWPAEARAMIKALQFFLAEMERRG